MAVDATLTASGWLVQPLVSPTAALSEAVTGTAAPISSRSDAARVVTDDNGLELYGVAPDGAILDNVATQARRTPDCAVDVSGGHLYMTDGAGRTKVLDGTTWPVVSASPLPGKRFSAVQARPLIGSHRPVVGTRDGLTVLADRDVLMHFILYGQSLAVGSQGLPLQFLAASFPEWVWTFAGGPAIDIRMGLQTNDGDSPGTLDVQALTGFRPLVSMNGQGNGSRGTTVAESLGAALVKSCLQRALCPPRLLFSAPGFGGTAYSGLKKGTQPYSNLIASVSRAKALAEARGLRYVCGGIVLLHGESDASSATYYADLLQWQSDLNADIKSAAAQAGDVPFFMGQSSSFYTSSGGAAALAMLKAHKDSPSTHVLVGPQYGYSYASDFLHMDGPGYAAFGAGAMASALLASAFGVGNWDPVRPLSIVLTNSQQLDVTFATPGGALQWDSSLDDARTTRGFNLGGGAGGVTITSATITGSNTVRFALSGPISSGAGWKLRGGLEGHSGSRTAATAPRTSLRDAAGNRCVHFEESI